MKRLHLAKGADVKFLQPIVPALAVGGAWRFAHCNVIFAYGPSKPALL